MPLVRPPRSVAASASIMAALLALLAAPLPASATDPIPGVPLPSEALGDSASLPASAGITFDLDGDGVKELVTIGAAADAQGRSAVSAWWVSADGSATQSNEVRLRRAASVDELLTGRGSAGIDREEMIAVRTSEPSRLFTARRNGADVVFVAGIGTPSDQPVACCLTIWEVQLTSAHTIDLTLVADTRQLALQIIPVDYEADGTDELFVNEGPVDVGDSTDRVNGPMEASVLHWNGERFIRQALRITALAHCCPVPMDAGETDGLPGEEVLLVGSDFDGLTEVVRMTVRDGQPFYESANIDDASFARAVTLGQGPRLLTTDGFSTLHRYSWARDQEPVEEAQRLAYGIPLAVFGSGERTRLMIGSQGIVGSVLVLPGDLGGGAGPSVMFGRDTRSGAFTGIENVGPLFSGALPDGLPGIPDAYVFSGELVRPLANPNLLAASQPAPLLVGLRPLGRVGPRGYWEALLDNFGTDVFFAPAHGTFIDMQYASFSGPLRFVGVDELSHGEVNDGILVPTFHGAALDRDHSNSMLVGNEAVRAEVQGPPGTEVFWRSRGTTGREVIGPSGSAQWEVMPAAGPNAEDGTTAIPTISAFTPAGHAYSGTWRIRVFRQPPNLSVAAPPGLVQLDSTVSGRTEPGASVTVNGVPATVSPTGAFSAPVAAGILPTEFRVVATDPLGNEATQVVSVVWPLDYRRLPFVPLAVVITVIAGAVLYLRKPDATPGPRSSDDDATFEEIGG